MFMFRFPGLKKAINVLYDKACISLLYATLGRCFLFSIMSLMLCAVEQTQAGAELCSQYRMPEFKSFCGGFSENQVTVHDSVPDGDLNSLRDSWNNTPGLHILPPGSYALTHAIELDEHQAILPHPTMQLPDDQTLRTIILTAGSDFNISNDHLYLLKLKPGSGSGGIEMHSSLLANSLASRGTKSLLWIESGGQVNLVGSYLTSSPSGHPLGQLIRVEASQEGGSNSGGEVYLARNLFKTSSYYGLVAYMQPGQKIRAKNTLTRISSKGGTGFAIYKGTGSVSNSDIVIEGRCSSGGCTGVSFNQTEQHSVSLSTFWSTLSNPWVATGVSLNSLNPPEFVLEKGSAGWLGTNLFSPQMTIMSDYDSSKDDTLTGRQLRTEFLNREYPLDAVQFFHYTGELGVTSLPLQLVENTCSDTNGTDQSLDPSLFQKKADFSNSSFDLYYPPARPDFSCSPRGCTDRNQIVTYLIEAEFFGGGLLVIILPVLSYFIGRHFRPPVPYQGLGNADASL